MCFEWFTETVKQSLKPNTHRRRRRDETVELRRVGGVYMNSQLTHDDCRRIRWCERRLNAAVGRDRVYNSAVNAIEVGWRNIWRCMFVNIRISRVV